MSQFDHRATGPATPTVRGVNWPVVDDVPRPPGAPGGPGAGPNPNAAPNPRPNAGWGPSQLSAPPTTVAPRPVAPPPRTQRPAAQRPVVPDWDNQDDWDRSPSPAARPGGNRSAEPSAVGWDDVPAWGRPAWQALLVMAVITAIGVVIDVVRDGTGGVNIAIIAASLAAILIVRRSAMFPVVIAPPLVYMLGSAAVLYLRSGGPHNKAVLIDIATNWLVYGFPAMAAASAVVLLIAAVRTIIKH